MKDAQIDPLGQRVTWLIAVKNGMPYLPETLASIEAQTYQNWEVLIWDNGSTDGTVEELQKWIPSRLPGRIVTDRPLQLALSRAELVKEAATEFCAWIDADDISSTNRLERQLEFLVDHPDVAVVGSQVLQIDQDGNDCGVWYRMPLRHDDIVHGLLTGCPICQPAIMFRRSKVMQAGNYRYCGPVNLEDYDLWLRIALGAKLANLDEPLIRYRVHPGSTTQISLKKNMLYEATINCLCQNSSQLFGCREEDARPLLERQHPHPLKVLHKIAKHLQRTQGGTVVGRMRSNSFLSSGTSLVRKRDVVSRLGMAALNHNPWELPREVLRIVRDVIT